MCSGLVSKLWLRWRDPGSLWPGLSLRAGEAPCSPQPSLTFPTLQNTAVAFFRVNTNTNTNTAWLLSAGSSWHCCCESAWVNPGKLISAGKWKSASSFWLCHWTSTQKLTWRILWFSLCAFPMSLKKHDGLRGKCTSPVFPLTSQVLGV